MTGFTLVEVVAALLILSMLISSALVVMGNITEGMIDLKAQTQAFSIARQNLEKLLTSPSVEDMSEYGIVETNPDMDWQTIVEPFYEPISNRMWVRGICSSSYTDSKGQRQTIELTCWLTGLNAKQIKQIIDQQKLQEEYMSQFSESKYGKELEQQREVTAAFLEQENMDTDAYQDFVERLDRRRLDYIAENGFDEGYFEFLNQLQQDESDFLYRLGVTDYDKFTEFYEDYVKNHKEPDAAGSKSSEKKNSASELDSERGDGKVSPKDKSSKQKPADTTGIPDEIKNLLPEDFFER
jgi:prepilin-type N-terminal cleavage/methylation domain-containing protein